MADHGHQPPPRFQRRRRLIRLRLSGLCTCSIVRRRKRGSDAPEERLRRQNRFRQHQKDDEGGISTETGCRCCTVTVPGDEEGSEEKVSMTWHPASEPPLHITDEGEKEISCRRVWLLYSDGRKQKGYYHTEWDGYMPVIPNAPFTCNLFMCGPQPTHWAEIERD